MLYTGGDKESGISGPHLLFPKGKYVLEYFVRNARCLSQEAKITLRVTTSGGAKEFISKDFSCLMVASVEKLKLEFELKKANRLELILRGTRGISFNVEKAGLIRI